MHPCTAFCVAATVILLASPAWGQEPAGNLLANPGFEDGLTSWSVLLGGDTDAKYAVEQGAGRDGSACVGYRKTAAGSLNHHFDQDFRAEPGQTYAFGAWVRGDGRLRPYLRIAGKDWSDVAGVAGPAGREWVLVQGVFESGEFGELKFQWFAGSLGQAREGFAGEAYLDDCFVRPATDEEVREARRAAITVRAGQPVQRISPLLFGSNMLFQVEDDASLADGRIAALLRDAGCTLLRFPGGAVADNYNWDTQALDRPKQWPGRAGPETTDTDEFMAFCRAVGAEPIFVCNFAKAISGPGLEEAVRSAAEWVRYCNIEKRYGIKYWEIGNETYLKFPETCTTAEEYAEGLVAFSRAMKAVDPTVRIGANGPSGPQAPGMLDTVPWWPVVFEKALDDLDFVIIHTYFGLGSYGSYVHSERDFGAPASSLREYLGEHYPARADTPIAVTEWNTGAKVVNSLGHAVAVANMLGDFARAGIALGNFWPLRDPGKRPGRGLLSRPENRPAPAYYALKAYATWCRGALVDVSCEAKVHVYAALSEDGKALNVFVVNAWPHAVGCELTVEGFGPAEAATLSVLTGPDAAANNDEAEDRVRLTEAEVKAGPTFALEAPGPSLCVVRLRAK